MAIDFRDDSPEEPKDEETQPSESPEPTPEEQEEHLKARDLQVAQTAEESAQAQQDEPAPTSPNVAHKQDKTHPAHGGPTDPDAAGRFQAWYDMRWTPDFVAEGDDREGYIKFLEAKGIAGGLTQAPVTFDQPVQVQEAQGGAQENPGLDTIPGKTGTTSGA